jgi:hypothetical protein
MPAPLLNFSVSGTRISEVSGYDHIDVVFSSDIEYVAFECRATKAGESYGRGVGKLIASFSTTPAGVERSFEVYNYDLIHGEGDYRISLYAKSSDGQWNDGYHFIPSGSTGLITADGKIFLSS